MKDTDSYFSTYKELLILTTWAIVIGAIVALIEVVFGKGLEFIFGIRAELGNVLFFGLPFAGLLIVFIFDHWGKISRRGMNLVFEVEQGISNIIPLRLVPFMIGSTWLTHLFGGSAGREGVAVQIGATISHFIGRKVYQYKDASTIFLVAGIAAGFSGLFSTPIAAVFFSIEVLVAGTLKYRAMGPAFAASFTACFVSSLFGLHRSSFLIDIGFDLNYELGFKLIILGIIFGIVGGAFASCLMKTKHFIHDQFKSPYIRIFCMGSILALLLFIVFQGRYSNLGENLIEASVYGGMIYSWDWILKFVFTIFTLSIGFQGGEVTPLFSIGASLGCVLASFFGIPAPLCAAMGYVAVFGAGTNTFLAPIAIGMEIFGYQYFPLFFVICCVSYLTNRNQSIYALQQRAGLDIK